MTGPLACTSACISEPMNSTSEQIKAGQNWSLLGRAGVREALVLVLAVLGLYVALALVSYSPADASWNFAGSTAAANNAFLLPK